jgi:hypothetical protein
MKRLFIIAYLFLSGCATVSVDKFIAEGPPPELVAAPMPLVEIVASSDGTVDLKGALAIAMSNNGSARHNADQLQKLEDWLKTTNDNIKKNNAKR